MGSDYGHIRVDYGHGHYSVATTKDNLSSLIDEALAGEEVIITRHGKPVIVMVPRAGPVKDIAAATARLRDVREAGKPVGIPLDRFYEWLYDYEER